MDIFEIRIFFNDGEHVSFLNAEEYKIMELAGLFIVVLTNGTQYGYRLDNIRSWIFTPYGESDEDS